ncbi:MAG: spore coat U domain-containing protein [Thermoanaerobaculia bacterium]
MIGHRIPAAVMVVAALVFASPLRAGSCTLGMVGSVAFGSYDVLAAAPVDSTGAITYSCSTPVSGPSISLGGGGSGFAPRELTSASHTLSYNLFLDAARTTVWGDGTAGTSLYDAPPPADGTNETITVYGRIPARQDVPRGAYSDSIVVTILF